MEALVDLHVKHNIVLLNFLIDLRQDVFASVVSLYGFTLTCIVLFLRRQADPNSLPMTLAQMVSYEVLLVQLVRWDCTGC